MGQLRLSSIAIIYLERSYANHILQVSMDRIIDIFGKRKNRDSFMLYVHVLINFTLTDCKVQCYDGAFNMVGAKTSSNTHKRD